MDSWNLLKVKDDWGYLFNLIWFSTRMNPLPKIWSMNQWSQTKFKTNSNLDWKSIVSRATKGVTSDSMNESPLRWFVRGVMLNIPAEEAKASYRIILLNVLRDSQEVYY